MTSLKSMASAKSKPQKIDFFFDIMCPWAYQTSIWIRDVRSQTDLEINWRFFSLEEINREDGKKHPWERDRAYGWTPLRIAAWLRRIDADLCDDWYLVAAKALHEDGLRPYEEATARELLASIQHPKMPGTMRSPTKQLMMMYVPTTKNRSTSSPHSVCH